MILRVAASRDCASSEGDTRFKFSQTHALCLEQLKDVVSAKSVGELVQSSPGGSRKQNRRIAVMRKRIHRDANLTGTSAASLRSLLIAGKSKFISQLKLVEPASTLIQASSIQRLESTSAKVSSDNNRAKINSDYGGSEICVAPLRSVRRTKSLVRPGATTSAHGLRLEVCKSSHNQTSRKQLEPPLRGVRRSSSLNRPSFKSTKEVLDAYENIVREYADTDDGEIE